MRVLPANISDGWTTWALPIGFLISVIGFFILRPLRTYVFAHEMTHVVWGLLMGAKIGRMKIGKSGGQVELSQNNFLISLAPYFFPFYTGLVIVFWYGLGLFFKMSRYEAWGLMAIGLTWGFHLTFTVYMLSHQQSDVHENGRLFSYVVIYLANLLLIALWIIFIGAPTFQDAWQLLCTETGVVYEQIAWIIRSGWDRLPRILHEFKMRYTS